MTASLLAGTPFPALDLPAVGGGRLRMAERRPERMTILNVYRGLHCPRCQRQLQDIVAHRSAFDGVGAEVISISTDPQDRAERAVADWGLGDMPVGYDLGIDTARALGLSISETIREAEPALFAEAAIFLVRPDGILWGSSINTFPFLRPTAAQLLDAVQTLIDRSYPPRGTVPA